MLVCSSPMPSTNQFNLFVQNIALNSINLPPLSYCSVYSNLPCLSPAEATEKRYPDAVIRELLDAAQAPSSTCPVTGITVSTPFRPLAWAAYLIGTRYPNVRAAVTLVKCLRLGVDLGFRGDRSLTQIGPNLISAAQHPDSVTANIKKEVTLQRRHRRYPALPYSFFYSNPLGVVFKRASTKARVVHHLSWPRTYPYTSVNASTLDFEISFNRCL